MGNEQLEQAIPCYSLEMSEMFPVSQVPIPFDLAIPPNRLRAGTGFPLISLPIRKN